jgi:hypothetical protein
MDRNSKAFKELQSKWYGKLKKSGFDDIEQDEEHLKIWHSHFFLSRYDATKYEAKEEYYRMAGHFLNDYKFKTKVEKLIWQYHCDGISLREITDRLKEKGHRAHKNGVHKTVQGLTELMVQSCRSKKAL